MDIFKQIEFNEELPKYIQIASYIKILIDKKVIKDKEKLPTIRALAKELSVNNVTIVSAYKKLQEEGYAFQKVGSGTYAKRKDALTSFRRRYSNILKKASMNEKGHIVDFTGEICNDILFPIDDLKLMINNVLERDGVKALVSDNRCGYTNLVTAINKEFWNNKLDQKNVFIVSGAQQGIDIAAKSILNINDNVIVEKPTYSGALSAFKWRKANIFEVEMQEDGIDIDKFEKILQKNDIRIFYTMSYFQNPTGISYSTEKKKRILDLAKIYDFYIIEDDYLSELIYNNDIEYIPFKSLDKNNRVIYIKSFSKIFLPGIRIGYLISLTKFRESIENSKLNTDITTSSLMQRALDEYLLSGKWKNNILELNYEYKKRYTLMKNILDTEFKDLLSYIDPKGGLTFYVTLKSDINTTKIFEELISKDVYITPSEMFYSSKEHRNDSFRLSFYQTDCEKIKIGMEILKEVVLKYSSNN